MDPQGQSRVILPGEGLGAGLVKGTNSHPYLHVEMPEGKGNSRAGQDGEAELRVNGLKLGVNMWEQTRLPGRGQMQRGCEGGPLIRKIQKAVGRGGWRTQTGGFMAAWEDGVVSSISQGTKWMKILDDNWIDKQVVCDPEEHSDSGGWLAVRRRRVVMNGVEIPRGRGGVTRSQR